VPARRLKNRVGFRCHPAISPGGHHNVRSAAIQRVELAEQSGQSCQALEGSASVLHLSNVLEWLGERGGYDINTDVADIAKATKQINVAKSARTRTAVRPSTGKPGRVASRWRQMRRQQALRDRQLPSQSVKIAHHVRFDNHVRRWPAVRSVFANDRSQNLILR
jgi:hypothetical protein